MKTPWGFLFGLISGLLGASLLWLATRPPRGEPITLEPPPTASPIVVYVGGAVLHPGLYTLPPGSRVHDALSAAGGLTSDADGGALNPAALLSDGQRVWVPSANEQNATDEKGPPGKKININLADSAELERLPGIGPATAQKIIAYREAHGDFQSIEDIMKVPGIGPATFERIRDQITVGP